MTIPLGAVPAEVRPPGSDHRPPLVLGTSLTAAFGVYTLLVQLIEPARLQLGTDRPFAYCKARDRASRPSASGVGLAAARRATRAKACSAEARSPQRTAASIRSGRANVLTSTFSSYPCGAAASASS